MNKFSVFAVLSCAAVFAMSGCTKSVETPEPEVSVEIGEVTMNSISFSVAAKNAVECAYVVVADGESVPSAAEILSDGISVDLSADSGLVAEGLEPSTEYTVAVAAASEDGKTAMDSASAATEADPAIVLDRASARQFGTSNNFQITLRGTVDDVEYEISLDMYDDEGKEAGYVTAGTYSIESGNTDGIVDASYSYVQKGNDRYEFLSGTMEVGITDAGYSIRVDSVLNDESSLVVVYNGTIEDVNGDIWPKSE